MGDSKNIMDSIFDFKQQWLWTTIINYSVTVVTTNSSLSNFILPLPLPLPDIIVFHPLFNK